MRIVLALIAAFALARPGWAADTDVENPSLRELPLQRSPISGGKQHQPTQGELSERFQEHGGAPSAPRATAAQRDDLYRRVLEQSRQGTPRSLDAKP